MTFYIPYSHHIHLHAQNHCLHSRRMCYASACLYSPPWSSYARKSVENCTEVLSHPVWALSSTAPPLPTYPHTTPWKPYMKNLTRPSRNLPGQQHLLPWPSIHLMIMVHQQWPNALYRRSAFSPSVLFYVNKWLSFHWQNPQGSIRRRVFKGASLIPLLPFSTELIHSP